MAPSSLPMFYLSAALLSLFLPAEAPLMSGVPNGGEQVVVGSLLSERPFLDEFIISKNERFDHSFLKSRSCRCLFLQRDHGESSRESYSLPK